MSDQKESMRKRGISIAADDVPVFEEVLETARAIEPVFRKQVGLIDYLVKALFKDKQVKRGPWRIQNYPSETMRNVLSLMLRGAEGSCSSILTLGNSGRPSGVRDCLPLGRSVVETLINVTYILAVGEEAAARMERHAMQKTYRDLYRVKEVEGFCIGYAAPSRPDISKHPEIEAALNEFTGKKGKEITTWTDVSLDDRLLVIKAKFGLPIYLRLHGAFFLIYRHSSEIIHGTYYGNLYFLGGPPGAREKPSGDLRATSLEHLVGLQHTLIGVIEGTMMAATDALGAPAYREAAKNVVKQMMQIPDMTPFIYDEEGVVN